MLQLITAAALFLSGGIAALLFKGRASFFAAFAFAAAAALCGLSVLPELLSGGKAELYISWSLPFGAFHTAADPLSGIFALALLIISPLLVCYAAGYLHEDTGRSGAKLNLFFMMLTSAAMLMVLISADSILFLISWEIMTIASFFMMSYDHDKGEVREAGWLYLVVAHTGGAVLLVMFLLMSSINGDTELHIDYGISAFASSALFLMALFGFGTKTGFLPLHVWLPEAHPAAPSHASAMMSGLMLNMGLYGFLRIYSLFAAPQKWWGISLIAIGAASAIAGLLYSISQKNIKRALAYSSIENMGIAAMGIGCGIMGISIANPTMIFFGFAGALMHMLNHSIFKPLLFLGAGASLHASGTANIEELGGLAKKMPVTSSCFLTGAAAISGLPPLNGFIGEFLIYYAAFSGLMMQNPEITVLMLAVIITLAISGGLAALSFTRLYGIVFSGEARTEKADPSKIHEAAWTMRVPMIIMSAICLVIMPFAPFIPKFLASTVYVFAEPDSLAEDILAGSKVLTGVSSGAAIFLIILIVLIFIRSKLPGAENVKSTVTWDCGYARPNARIQYTGTSFSRPVTDFFRLVLPEKKKQREPRGFFPKNAYSENVCLDFVLDKILAPLAELLIKLCIKLHAIQCGNLHVYILYMIVTLLILLIWKLA